MSVKTFKKNYIFTFLDFVAVFGQDKIGHSKLSQSSSADHPTQRCSLISLENYCCQNEQSSSLSPLERLNFETPKGMISR